MEIHHISRTSFVGTVGWALILCMVIVATVAGLARATFNLQGALIEKPDIAVYLLLPDEEIGAVELLRENENERDYLADTKEGKKLIKLHKGEKEWYVAEMERLHE
jgi:hypothetical protein